MPSLVVADWLKHREIGPTTARRRSARLQHRSHLCPNLTQFTGLGTHYFPSDDGARRLAKQARFYALSEIGDPSVFNIEIDGYRRSAQF